MDNPYGFVQGGILAGFIDNVIGVAMFTLKPERRPSTVNLSLNYLRPARSRETIRGVAEVIREGRRQMYVEARLERENDDEVLVKATAINLLVDE
jgi:uncharacterized protein (TIGR00369 family)